MLHKFVADVVRRHAHHDSLDADVMQAWQEHGFAFEWGKEAGLDVRGLRFARDVRRQLEGITGPNGSHLLGQRPFLHYNTN